MTDEKIEAEKADAGRLESVSEPAPMFDEDEDDVNDVDAPAAGPYPAQLPPPPQVQRRSVTHDFFGALLETYHGNAVSRLEWKNSEVYVYRGGGFLRIRLATGAEHALLLADGDMDAQDWVVVPIVSSTSRGIL